MADRGFQIKEEDHLFYFGSLIVPPGTRIKSLTTSEESKKTKEIARLRMYFEGATNGINIFVY